MNPAKKPLTEAMVVSWWLLVNLVSTVGEIGNYAMKRFLCSDGGIVVSIAAFQAVDLGSIPSHRSSYFYT